MRQNKIIGFVSAIALSLIVATLIGPSNVHVIYAGANCDKAGGGLNTAGNFKGNDKQCGLDIAQGPKEPIRNCNSPSQKDNDADSFVICKNTGKH